MSERRHGRASQIMNTYTGSNSIQYEAILQQDDDDAMDQEEGGGVVVVDMKQMLYTNDIAMNFIYIQPMLHEEKADLYLALALLEHSLDASSNI